jgi:hypothetical protein
MQVETVAAQELDQTPTTLLDLPLIGPQPSAGSPTLLDGDGSSSVNLVHTSRTRRRKAARMVAKEKKAEVDAKCDDSAGCEVAFRMLAIQPVIQAKVLGLAPSGSDKARRNVAEHNFNLAKPFGDYRKSEFTKLQRAGSEGTFLGQNRGADAKEEILLGRSEGTFLGQNRGADAKEEILLGRLAALLQDVKTDVDVELEVEEAVCLAGLGRIRKLIDNISGVIAKHTFMLSTLPVLDEFVASRSNLVGLPFDFCAGQNLCRMAMVMTDALVLKLGQTFAHFEEMNLERQHFALHGELGVLDGETFELADCYSNLDDFIAFISFLADLPHDRMFLNSLQFVAHMSKFVGEHDATGLALELNLAKKMSILDIAGSFAGWSFEKPRE